MWKSAYIGVYQLLNWKMHGETMKKGNKPLDSKKCWEVLWKSAAVKFSRYLPRGISILAIWSYAEKRWHVEQASVKKSHSAYERNHVGGFLLWSAKYISPEQRFPEDIPLYRNTSPLQYIQVTLILFL